MNRGRERRAILRLAFVDSLPVLMGYSTMGFGYLDGLLFLGFGIPALNGMAVAAIAYCLLRRK